MNKARQLLKVFKQLKIVTKQNMEKQFKGMNITAPQGMVIGILSHEGKMKIGELSEKIGLSISTVSGIIDRLEKQNITERIRSEEDRRVVFVDLTDKFKEESKDRFHHMEMVFQRVLSKAAPEEVNAIIYGMSLLEKLLKENANN